MQKADYTRRLRALTRPPAEPTPTIDVLTMGSAGGTQTFPEVRAQAPAADVADGVATIRLYDPIDSWGEWWGVSAKELAQTVDQLPADVTEIQLHINSPGGDVFDGIAIMNTLRATNARVVAIVDGIAASAASFVAVAADEVVMAPNSELMIHDAWGLCVGNAAEMTAMAGLLAHLSDNIASIYAAKAGGTVAEWRAAMERESWYSAEEAVAIGLADRVDTTAPAGTASNRFDLSIFNYAGRAAAPPPHTHVEASGHASTETDAPAPAGAEEGEPARSNTHQLALATLASRHAMTKEVN